jgi:hypothetical protein
VLFVDDSQLLDPTSATLIGQMLDAGLLLLLATVRDGHLMLDVGNPQGDSWVQRPSHRDESRVLRSFTEVVDAR